MHHATQLKVLLKIKLAEIKRVKPINSYFKSASEDNTAVAEKETEIEENRDLENTVTSSSEVTEVRLRATCHDTSENEGKCSRSRLSNNSSSDDFDSEDTLVTTVKPTSYYK